MGDNAALRAKRYRHHKAGDHSLCVIGRCDALSGRVRPAAAICTPTSERGSDAPPPVNLALTRDTEERIPGEIEADTATFVAALPYGPTDPRALMARIAVKLARRIDETGANPAAVRELRTLLVQLVELPNAQAGRVDETRLRAAQRRLDGILAGAG